MHQSRDSTRDAGGGVGVVAEADGAADGAFVVGGFDGPAGGAQCIDDVAAAFADGRVAPLRLNCPKCGTENRVGGGFGYRSATAPITHRCDSCRRELTLRLRGG